MRWQCHWQLMDSWAHYLSAGRPTRPGYCWMGRSAVESRSAGRTSRMTVVGPDSVGIAEWPVASMEKKEPMGLMAQAVVIAKYCLPALVAPAVMPQTGRAGQAACYADRQVVLISRLATVMKHSRRAVPVANHYSCQQPIGSGLSASSPLHGG